MNLKALSAHLFKLREDTLDIEKHPDVSTLLQASRKATKGSEIVGSTLQSHGSETTCEGGGGPKEGNLPCIDSNGQPHATQRGPRRFVAQVLSTIFPSPNNDDDIQAFTPHYRVLPILSGVVAPFCILLDIPGLLTADRDIRAHGLTVTGVALQPNPPLLDIGITLSLLCAILTNVCLAARFLEKRIKTMTILCIVFLLTHDFINIITLAMFGAIKDDCSFSEAFWTTFCSTLVSMFTNVTLIIDLIQTPDFARSGSGLTRRQRSLVIIVIGLFCYIMLGTLVNSFLFDLAFIDGLYFTVGTIELLGFGDIVPQSTGSRIFTYFYAPLGVITLAFVVAYVRETVLEGLHFGHLRRLLAIQERRKAARLRRRAEKQWRHAITWRLREQHAPIWIPKNANDRMSIRLFLSSYFWRLERGILSTMKRSIYQNHGQHGMQLNLWALPPCQLESAALEAGCTLDTFLPPDFYDTYSQGPSTGAKRHRFLFYPRDEHSTKSLTHHRLGAMAAVLTKLCLAVHGSTGDLQNGHGIQDGSIATWQASGLDSSGILQMGDQSDYRTDVAETEKQAYYTRCGVSGFLLFIFWMGGAAIFKATEGWTYGVSVYFCFFTLTTIGYGDVAPTTLAGRSIFVVWAMIGVAITSIFISVASEAYTLRYKSIFSCKSVGQDVRQYCEHNKVELSEVVQPGDISPGVTFVQEEHEKSDVVRAESPQTIPEVTSVAKPDLEAQNSQRSLERLQDLILTETQGIQQYMRLIGGFDGYSEVESSVDDAALSLVDNIMDGRRLSKESKRDILMDRESRQMLVLLGITRSLKTLVSFSEQAISVIREYRTAATLKQEAGGNGAGIVV